MINEDTRKAIAAALEALATAESSIKAARELTRSIAALQGPPSGPRWLEDHEVVARFRVTKRMFLDAHREGLLDSRKVGRKVIATEESVQRWIDRRRGGSGAS